ncbi:hypothetical protein F0P96_18075 [Hymenobacter busanensis]|uniref:Uncharacterized protein n=1 Tax=Hymenobacter busanensis TaxID=2607656 RepID=A0A7L4ZRP5_9BACT|nr:hypothetical protein [Hymenobacter busanensis]KAA9327144.1 hypothetical protein F0P96_18075 [Hymenobacter busanensis]QHJ05809.1 hypothetical protein GUY19_00270 [Hymenobacter busanensis]
MSESLSAPVAPTAAGALVGTTASAATYDFVQIAPEQDLIVARMHVKASEVNKLLRERDPRGLARDSFLYVCADTFVLDDQFFDAPMITIVARVVEAGSFPFVMPEDNALHMAGLQILTQEIRGGLTVAASSNREWTVPTTFNAAQVPQVIVCAADATLFKHEVSAAAAQVAEVARNPHVWNILKAEFAAASEWLDVPAQRAAGLAALHWVALCTRALAAEPGPLAAEASQLNYQAAALLLLASGAGTARYVPVWSEEYLKTRINQLLAVLQGYENKIQGLEIRTDVQQAVESVAQALRDVAGADERALATSAQLNEQETAATWKQYHELLWTYETQTHAVRLAFLVFKGGLDHAATLKTLGAVLQIVNLAGQMAGAYFGAGVPDPKAAQAAAGAAKSEAAQVVITAQSLEKMVLDAIKKELLERVMKLKASLEKMAKIAAAAAEAGKKAVQIANAQKMEARSTVALPDLADMATLDPELDWNLFITQAELALRESINGNGETNPPVSGAKEYYLSLYALAEYGKALSRKTVALARLQARALEIEAQRAASRFALERWERLRAEAKTAEEQLSLGKSLLQEAALNTKRSLLVMAEGYRAAYAYNNLTDPPMRLRLSMDYNALNQEFTSIKQDIAQFFAAPRLAQEVDTGYFELPVVRASSAQPAPAGHAVLTLPAAAGAKPLLSWSMPLDQPPFRAWLSPGQYSAYFIEEAWFYLDGALPNADGLIGLRVATTGNYQNGYGGQPSAQFSAQGLGLNFGYAPAQGRDAAPFTHWRPAGRSKDNYMRPSPFATWLATIEQAGDLSGLHTLRIKLKLLRQDLA